MNKLARYNYNKTITFSQQTVGNTNAYEAIRTLLLLFIMLCSSFIHAQEYCSTKTIEQAVTEHNSALITAYLFINKYPSKKEQFYNDWTNGTIYFENGTTAFNCKLRYNAWLDELIWLRETDYKMGVVLKSTVKKFVLNNKKGHNTNFVKHLISNDLSNTPTYIEVLTTKQEILSCHRKVTFNKSTNNFTAKPQFYLVKNGEFNKVKLSKKSILQNFSESEQKHLKQILKDQKLNVKNEYDLAKAFDLFFEGK